MLLEISSIPFVFGKTYTQVFLRFSAVARPASLANTGFSGLRHLAASSVKITQAGFVPPVLKTVRAKVHRGSNPLPSASSKQALIARIPALRRGFLARRACFSLPNRTHCAAVGGFAALRMRRAPCGYCVGLRFGFRWLHLFCKAYTRQNKLEAHGLRVCFLLHL